MSLENLVKTHQLAPHKARAIEVQRLLAAASRNLVDAGAKGISDETRFDCAYKTIMQCALIGLLANGYRPATSTPGHHQAMIQTLPLTLGVERSIWIVLDALRKKRNVNDYSGDLLEPERDTRMHRAREGATCPYGSLAWAEQTRPFADRQAITDHYLKQVPQGRQVLFQRAGVDDDYVVAALGQPAIEQLRQRGHTSRTLRPHPVVVLAPAA